MKLIFDFGANNGQNLAYFIEKSDLVVAVEPNPMCVELINKKFFQEILDGRLVVENIVLVDSYTASGLVNFYINKKAHTNSTVIQPKKSENYETIRLLSMTAHDMIKKYLKRSMYCII